MRESDVKKPQFAVDLLWNDPEMSCTPGGHQKLMAKMESVCEQQQEMLAHLRQLTAEREVSGATVFEDILDRPASSIAELQELCGRLEEKDFRKKMVRAVGHKNY